MHRSMVICGLISSALFLTQPSQAALGKADIAVTDVSVNSDCFIVATIKNVGTTPLPVAASDAYYGTAIAFLLNGVQFSEFRLSSGLQQPGGTATYTAGTNQINGTANIGARFDTKGSYEDVNPANNILNKTVSCTPPAKPKPDLAITSLDFTADCRPIVRVANLGTASIQDYTFTTTYLQRKVDNLPSGQLYLRAIDSAGRLKLPQGTVEWTDGKEFTPQSSLQYVITNNSVAMDDANFNNNASTINLPDRCKSSGSSLLGKADIAVTDVSVNSDCFIVATIKNVGTTPLPVAASDAYYGTAIAFLLNGVQFSEFRLSSGLQQPGGTATYTAGTNQINGTANIGARFDTKGSYEDVNPANNILNKTVSCTPPAKPKPDLAITSLDFTADCRPIIRVANLGTASIQDYTFTTTYLQRKVDNLPSGQLYLRAIDSAGRLKLPQGTVEWTDGKEFTPQSSLQYVITNNSVAMEDANFNNNASTINLPDRCKASTPIRSPAMQQRPVLPKQNLPQIRKF